MSPPDAMAMYCWPSNWYAIGEACQFAFAWNDHNGLPLAASAAANAPLSSPKNTRPVDVASVPPHVEPMPA